VGKLARIIRRIIKKVSSNRVDTDVNKHESVNPLPDGIKRLSGSSGIYKIYSAPDKQSGMDFLERHKIDTASYVVIVETPEGTFAKDIKGIYGRRG
jgi:hypothetical protein